MRYVSTRGQAPVRDFSGVLLAGLAEDGGLYVPEAWPEFSPADWRALRGLPYPELAARDLAGMHAHGVRAVALATPIAVSLLHGKPQVDCRELCEELRLVHEAGLTGPIPYFCGSLRQMPPAPQMGRLRGLRSTVTLLVFQAAAPKTPYSGNKVTA